MRQEFERIGDGEVLNNSPYDLAAPWLCLREAGGVVSDGWGDRSMITGCWGPATSTRCPRSRPQIRPSTRCS